VSLALGVQLLPEVLNLAGQGLDKSLRPVGCRLIALSRPAFVRSRPVGRPIGSIEDDVDRPPSLIVRRVARLILLLTASAVMPRTSAASATVRLRPVASGPPPGLSPSPTPPY